MLADNVVAERRNAPLWAKHISGAPDDGNYKAERSKLPIAVSKMKKLMQEDEVVKMIATETPLLFSKAVAVLMVGLITRSYEVAKCGNRSTVVSADVKQAIQSCDCLEFLGDLISPSEPYVYDTPAVFLPNIFTTPTAAVSAPFPLPAVAQAISRAELPREGTSGPPLQEETIVIKLEAMPKSSELMEEKGLPFDEDEKSEPLGAFEPQFRGEFGFDCIEKIESLDSNFSPLPDVMGLGFSDELVIGECLLMEKQDPITPISPPMVEDCNGSFRKRKRSIHDGVSWYEKERN